MKNGTSLIIQYYYYYKKSTITVKVSLHVLSFKHKKNQFIQLHKANLSG